MTNETNTAPDVTPKTKIRMLALNDIRISGRLTADPKSRLTKDGRLVVHLNLAINRGYKDAAGVWHQQASFIPVTVWNALAEKCKKRLQKGSPLYVEGRLRSEMWQADGQKRYALKVDAARLRFMTPKKPWASNASYPADNPG